MGLVRAVRRTEGFVRRRCRGFVRFSSRLEVAVTRIPRGRTLGSTIGAAAGVAVVSMSEGSSLGGRLGAMLAVAPPAPSAAPATPPPASSLLAALGRLCGAFGRLARCLDPRLGQRLGGAPFLQARPARRLAMTVPVAPAPAPS